MSSLKVAFIKANWHSDIVSQALVGFQQEMESQHVSCDVQSLDVPGAFEMPLLAQRLAKSGRYDAIVCAALVVDGGIYRHDFVAQAVVSGLMQAQLATEVPMYSISLTPHHFQPTAEHIGFYTEHFVKKGQEAARAVVQIHSLQMPKD
ncbi:6,7-dimethyl-8-ribityllumazine synthase [Enterobacter hormaechei]|uniref:6,7-dimethyl-8-ribityllumazine synthase n=1 Tax=Enterobacter hormaechei TaxID=158836 RepID=UPI001239B3B2|nr:6,7-dimethyl-8-ribityllumazine synthase [Enterobacter hormaechei]MBK4412497.1 6,7-dimethyl-8-ribityllumazine synthase [Enterobacter hormaechei]MCE1416515.1 6,7-dimethyl-8-ribityllumazine synthase [Enterobacter hormaechei]